MGARRNNSAAEQLATAYKQVFLEGDADRTQTEMVIADLANEAGFFSVFPSGASGMDLAEANGKRAVYGRILGFLNLSDAEMRALSQAASMENVANSEEGEIL